MMQSKVVGIISKCPDERGDPDIRSVLPWLRKKSDLLNTSDDDVLIDIVRNCAYRRALRDDLIVTQGDIGDCFFIMLSGKTSVYIDTIKSDDDGQTEPDGSGEQAASYNSSAKRDVKLKLDDDDDDDDDDDENDDESSSEECVKRKKPLDRSEYGKFIIHYEAGKSFGEIALISDDAVRNATVIADEETDLLVIYRGLFDRSMKAKQEKEYEERKEFISRFKIFNDWSNKFKHLLEMSIRKEEYPYGAHIIRQGEPVNGLYFIISGQAKVSIEQTQHASQYPQFLNRVSAVDKELGRQNKENVGKKVPGCFTQSHIRIRRKHGYAAAEKRVMTRSVELCCVEGTEIQGDLEMVMEMATSCCTVTATANTTAFILDAKNYDRLILKKNTHTINKLREGVLKKLSSRITTPNGCQIPLLKIIHDDLYELLKPKQKTAFGQKQVLQKDKQQMASQMIHLYLKNKTPMIDPVLHDSFYYRLMTEKRNRVMASREKRKEEKERLYNRAKRRVPRSLKQLQNSAAETELMHPSREVTEYFTQPTHTSTKREKLIRPRTAIGIESYSSSDVSSKHRPDTAAGRIFHLTECDVNEDFGNVGVTAGKVVPVTPDMGQLVNQIDAFQRDKLENRSRVVCSAAVKTELKTDLERANIHKTVDEYYDIHDEDYFDYETSSTNLKQLEDRIKHFCSKVGQRRLSDPFRVNELRCYQVEGSNIVPLAGGTVLVKKKPCVYPPNIKVGKDTHQHVRRFMINRIQTGSTASMRERSKSAMASMGRTRYAW